jgi:anti-sigma-K factor RskA
VAASIILLIGSLILTYTFYNKYQSTSNDLQIAQAELQKQQQVAEGMKTDMDVMTDKNALPVVLNGTEKSPDALAKIFWMKNTGDVYVDPTNLPQAPSGMQYQLWAIVDGKPVDAGMIATKKGIYHIQKMKSFGKAQAFAITLETAGGHPTPKGDMIVMAKI